MGESTLALSVCALQLLSDLLPFPVLLFSSVHCTVYFRGYLGLISPSVLLVEVLAWYQISTANFVRY